MAITEYNYIPKYIERTIANKPKDVVTASYWNELFNLLITQGDHTAKELGNILNHFSTALAGVENEIAESAEDIANIRGVFRINVTYSNGLYSADKTFDEIKAAYDAGQYPYVVSDGDTVYMLSDCFLSTPQMCMDFTRHLIGENTLKTEKLRIHSYTTTNGSNIERLDGEFNIPIGVLEVTLTTQNGVTVADKTFAQVETAIYDGIPVLKVHSDGDISWFFLLDKSPTEIDFIGLADEQILAYLTAKQDGTWETTVAARVTTEMLSSLNDKIGNIGQLTTADKTNLVAAVNEVKQTTDNKQDKLIAGENITIAADGKTISAINCSDKILSVTITGYTDAEIVADKTYAEIKAAIDSGYSIHTIDNNGDIFVPRVNFESVVERITLAWTERLDSNTWVEVVYEVNTQDSWGVTLREYVTPSEIGNLIALKTQAKDNLVAAINEVKQTTDTKQDKLIAGENITISTDGKTISATGGGGSSVPKPLTYDYMPEGYPTKTMGTVTLMEEQELAFLSSEFYDSNYVSFIPTPLDIAEGQTYTVNWDGTEYECVGFYFNGEGIFLGNISVLGVGDDTGEPFLYGYNSYESENIFITPDTSPRHTISVKGIDEVAIPMSAEFIPHMNVSAFTNDAGYLTLDTLPKYGGESV